MRAVPLSEHGCYLDGDVKDDRVERFVRKYHTHALGNPQRYSKSINSSNQNDNILERPGEIWNHSNTP